MARLRARDLRVRLRQLAAAFPERVETIQKDLARVGLNAVVQATPYDTGRLAYGWDVGVGAPSSHAPPEGDSFPNDAEERGKKAIASATPLAPLLITNNVPYAAVWETGSFEPADPGPSKGNGKKGSTRRQSTEGVVLVEGGFNTRAPAGMLVEGVAAIERKLREYEKAGIELGRLS